MSAPASLSIPSISNTEKLKDGIIWLSYRGFQVDSWCVLNLGCVMVTPLEGCPSPVEGENPYESHLLMAMEATRTAKQDFATLSGQDIELVGDRVVVNVFLSPLGTSGWCATTMEDGTPVFVLCKWNGSPPMQHVGEDGLVLIDLSNTEVVVSQIVFHE